MTKTEIHSIISNFHAVRDGKSGRDLRMSDGSLWFHPNDGCAPRMVEPAKKGETK